MGDQKPRHKLFRAIVVLGAAVTGGAGCDDSRCHHCEPPPPDASKDAAPVDVAASDGPVDGDPVDVILIL